LDYMPAVDLERFVGDCFKYVEGNRFHNLHTKIL
jgi:hypothetical protein